MCRPPPPSSSRRPYRPGAFQLTLRARQNSKPKTYLVPERERTEAPPASLWGLLPALMKFRDREIINKCGLDAYFYLRYMKTLLVIFLPIAAAKVSFIM